jgi:hypothetical protein
MPWMAVSADETSLTSWKPRKTTTSAITMRPMPLRIGENFAGYRILGLLGLGMLVDDDVVCPPWTAGAKCCSV